MMEIIFRGDIVPGKNIVEVKDALKTRFKLDDAGITRMFSGRPITIKKGLTETDAEKFCALLRQLGAVVTVKDTEGQEISTPVNKTTTQAATSVPTSSAPLDSQPSVAKPTAPETIFEEKTSTPKQISAEPANSKLTEMAAVNSLTISNVGDDVLNAEERRDYTPANIDTSDLSLSPDGTDVLDDEHKTPFKPADIDTSHLDIESEAP